MENVSEALLMAGCVLIFIIALTVSISSFTTLRVGIDNIFSQTETIDKAKINGEYVNYIKNTPEVTRVVGAETVISSMYRSVKENYVIYIKLKDYSGLTVTQYDGRKITLSEYINPVTNVKEDILKIQIGLNDWMLYNNDAMENFYKKISNYNFSEFLGEYQNKSEASEENKLTYRIITYVQN